MSSDSSPRFSRFEAIGVVAIVSFGLTSVFAVLGLGVAVPLTFIVGFFLLIPLIALLGDDLPMIESDSDEPTSEEHQPTQDPVDRLREAYATGTISEEEFDRRLEKLLETEDIDSSDSGRSTRAELERLREKER